MKVPLFKPSVGQEEIDEIADTIRSKWIGLGPKVARFEKEFARYVGSKYAIGTSSCTIALQIALATIRDRRKRILTTPITFASTPHTIVHNRRIPVFVDVLWDTININPESIKLNLSKAVAIMLVHYGGHPCKMDEINRIARENNLVIIEDCAHACGSEYKGKKIGSSDNINCFSFHAVKNLATGDGGMITTNSQKLYEEMKRLRWLGIDKSTYSRDTKQYQWKYSVGSFGYKGNMNDITASMGLVQLRKLDRMNQKRRRIVEEYNKAFEDLKEMDTPFERKGVKSSWHFYAIKTKEREKLRVFLGNKGISTGVHYLPMFLHPVYKKSTFNCPIARGVWKYLLSLPVYPDMTKEELEWVIKNVREFYNNSHAH